MTVFGPDRSAEHDGGSSVNRRRLKTLRRSLFLLVAVIALASVVALGGNASKPAAAADPPTAQITVSPHDLHTGDALSHFTYIVNVDNAHLGDAARVADRPMRAPTESFSPIVAEGNQDRASVDLPSDCTDQANVAKDGHGCRYLIS